MASAKATKEVMARALAITKHMPDENPVMVEVGVFKGHLAEHLLGRVPSLRWHGVDNWLSADDQPEDYKTTGDTHANATPEQVVRWRAEAHNTLKRFEKRASIHEKSSVEAAPDFADESIDIVFLDGDHSYAGCLADLRAWWPKVRPGGWLGGHDYANPDPRFRYGVMVVKAVTEFANEVGLKYDLSGGMTYWFRKP